jgi:ArsR family transcriptional regulator
MKKSAVASIDVRPLSRLFKALGDETRLRIVALLSHGELCVCHVEKALELSQPNVSRQFAVLRYAGIVEPRRQGNWIYYKLTQQVDEDCKRLLNNLTASFSKRELLQKDVERVTKCCGPEMCL